MVLAKEFEIGRSLHIICLSISQKITYVPCTNTSTHTQEYSTQLAYRQFSTTSSTERDVIVLDTTVLAEIEIDRRRDIPVVTILYNKE